MHAIGFYNYRSKILFTALKSISLRLISVFYLIYLSVSRKVFDEIFQVLAALFAFICSLFDFMFPTS
jgi:hypothetical protein